MMRTRRFVIVLAACLGSAAHADPKAPAKVQQPAPAAFTLSLADAIQSALANHPDTVKQRAELQIADIEVDRQRALFLPVLTAMGSYLRTGTYISTTNDPNQDTSTTKSLQVQVAGKTNFGGTYQLNVTGRSSDNVDGSIAALAPYNEAIVSARFTQPLLRDGGFTPNQGLIDRAALLRDQARAQQFTRDETLALQVIVAYWALVVQREQLKIRQTNVSEAADLRELIDRRIKGGQAPRSDAVEADVTVAQREQLVRQARLAVIDAERDLLSLTYLNRTGKFKFVDDIVPAEKPSDAPVKVNFDQELETALKHRPEVQRHDREIQAAKYDHAIAENAKKLKLDVYGEAGLYGLSGIALTGTSIVVPSNVVGSYSRSIKNLVALDAPFFQVGVNLEIPLGNGFRSGAAAQSELKIAEVEADDVRTLIALDVRAALQQLDVATLRIDGAANAEKLAVLNVEAQKKRYEGGAATIFDTLRSQDDLARAKAERVLAAAEREIAESRLFAARGTLLQQFGIAVTAR